jgi:protein-tyrosine phosphatase
MKILFICTGNICRSPLAHALLRDQIQKKDLSWQVDSAGIHGFHEGELPDSRTLKVAQAHGITMQGIFSKPVSRVNPKKFDLILVMDSSHQDELIHLGWPPDSIHLLLEYVGLGHAVADPYYGDEHGFDNMFSILNQAIQKLVVMQKK